MSGVSLGWFDPLAIAPDLTGFLMRANLEIGRGRKGSAIGHHEAAQACYYTHVRRPTELAIKRIGYRNGAGPEWHFIMAASNRPGILLTEATEQNMVPIAIGAADPDNEAGPAKIQPVRLNCMELVPGLALHFDSTKFWHGYTQFPVAEVPGVEQDLPSVFIIRLGKYIPAIGDNGSMLGRAVEACRAIVDKGTL